MSNQPITVQLEIPPEVAQQEVWDLEKQVQQVAGITTDLREPRDLGAVTQLIITVVGPATGQAVALAGGIKTIYDLAEILYHFLHPKKPAPDGQQGKTKVVIVTKGKRIELYNYSVQEIEQLLKS